MQNRPARPRLTRNQRLMALVLVGVALSVFSSVLSSLANWQWLGLGVGMVGIGVVVLIVQRRQRNT